MPGIFDKLNMKTQSRILVCNAPESFEPQLKELRQVEIHRKPEDMSEIEFSIAFVIKQAELNKTARSILKKAKGDAIIWFAYPKKTSKKYKCEFDRDNGWEELGKAGYEPVRMVAIDEDWSALRFRNVQYIKTMKRDASRALSKDGKDRTANKE